MSKNKAKKFLSSLNDEDREQFMKDMKEELLGDDEQEAQSKPDGIAPSVDGDFVVKNRSLNQNRRRSKVKAGKNQWADNGEFKDVGTPLPEDFEKTPRRKAAPKKTSVECHMCGKTFKQDSRYSYGDYPRCNKCTGR
jgi:hypothetical protein